MPIYCYDLDDPHQFIENPYKFKPKISFHTEWYDRRHDEDFQNQLIYKYDKTIPQIVQEVLENIGFIEWD